MTHSFGINKEVQKSKWKEIWKVATASHVARCRYKQRFETEHPDGLLIQNFVMDYQMLGEADTTGYGPDAIKTESENFCVTDSDSRETEIADIGRTDVSDSACHTFPPCVFLAFLPFVVLHRI